MEPGEKVDQGRTSRKKVNRQEQHESNSGDRTRGVARDRKRSPRRLEELVENLSRETVHIESRADVHLDGHPMLGQPRVQVGLEL